MPVQNAFPKLLSLTLLSSLAAPADSATVDAFFSENTTYRFTGLPDIGTRTLAAERVRLADGHSQGMFLLSANSGADLIGIWRTDGSAAQAVARPNRADATGPNRPGLPDVFYPISTSPFRSFEQGDGGAIVFLGKAADPALGATFATRGLWLNRGAANVEIARAETAGTLGPNMGAGIVFENSDTFVRRLLFADSGTLLAYARVGQAGNFDDALLRHDGTGWVPCAVDESPVAAWSPGVGNLTFDNLSTGFAFVLDPQGRAYGMNRMSNAQVGVWSYCTGAPQLRVLEATTGATGPGLGSDSRFTSLSRSPLPLNDGDLVVYGTAAASGAGGAPQFTGYFRNQPGNNGPIALIGTSDATGPQVSGATFSALPDDALTQGGWLAFKGTIAGASGSVPGLWRWHAGTGIQPVALQRVGAFSPSATTFWTALNEHFVTDRGEVIVFATVCDRTADNLGCVTGSQRNEYWSLPPSGAPVRLLGPGDTVRFRTAAGAQQATITSVEQPFNDLLGGSGYESTGRDYWINRRGILHASVNASGFPGTLHVRLQAFDPGRLFRDGFE